MDSARFAAASLSAQQNRLDGLHTHPRPSSAGEGTRAAGSAERESHGWKGTWPGGWRGCSRETSTAAAGFSEGWEGGKRINTAMRPQLDTESARRPGQDAESALRTWPRRLGCTAGSRRWGRTLRGLCAAGPTSPEPAAAAPAAAAAATSTGCTYSAPVRRCALSGISALGCAAPQRGSCVPGGRERGDRTSRGRRRRQRGRGGGGGGGGGGGLLSQTVRRTARGVGGRARTRELSDGTFDVRAKKKKNKRKSYAATCAPLDASSRAPRHPAPCRPDTCPAGTATHRVIPLHVATTPVTLLHSIPLGPYNQPSSQAAQCRVRVVAVPCGPGDQWPGTRSRSRAPPARRAGGYPPPMADPGRELR
jgi:hypothetical protein